MLCVEKCEATNLFEAGCISFLWLICGVPTLKCIQFGQFTSSVIQVLALVWSYLWGGVHFGFTWPIILVVVVVIYAETAIFCSYCLCWVVLVTRCLYF